MNTTRVHLKMADPNGIPNEELNRLAAQGWTILSCEWRNGVIVTVLITRDLVAVTDADAEMTV